jgi:hypothetical protein
VALSDDSIRELPPEEISLEELRGLLTEAIGFETSLINSDVQLKDGRAQPEREGQTTRR